MHIIHIASELAPIAKVGGLGDVLYGLSQELFREGHTVQILLPKYDTINYNQLQNLRVYYRDLWSYDGEHCYNNTIWSAELEGLNVLLIEPHHPKFLFSRGTIYGCQDDIDRFFYFSRTCMEFLFKANLRPDVIHVHDWQTALVPLLQQDMYKHLGWKPIKTVLTLHNLEHQGKCFPHHLTRSGLRGEDYLSAEKLQDPQNLDLVNILKGGILYSDILTTVSPSYKKEITFSKEGFGLQDFLKQHQNKLHGILNGIDENFWNPEIDKHLPTFFPAHPPFPKEKWELIQKKREFNKDTLRTQLGLCQKKAPLIACIARLVEQKGVFLIAHAFKHILSTGAQCVILGSSSSKEILRIFENLQTEYKSNTNGKIILEYNESLSHQIYAGSDILLIPSLFEPCGLTQMIALRYGSIPIARKTGGLADTVFDIDTASCKPSDRNGFCFEKPEEKEFSMTIDRAIRLWQEDPSTWQKLMQQGFAKDFSWKKAAQEYLNLYKTNSNL